MPHLHAQAPRLRQALEHRHGTADCWPLPIRAAAAHLTVLEDLICDLYTPVLQCAIEAVYTEIEEPTPYDFLNVRRQQAFERRFGTGPDPRLDLAYTTLNGIETLLGKDTYRQVIRAAYEASHLEHGGSASHARRHVGVNDQRGARRELAGSATNET